MASPFLSSSAPGHSGLVPPLSLDLDARARIVARLADDPAAGWLGLDAAADSREAVAERLVDAFVLFARARFEAEAAEAAGGGAARAGELGCSPAVAAVWAAFADASPEAYGRFCDAHFGRPLPVEGASDASRVAATWAWLTGCSNTAGIVSEQLAQLAAGDDHAATLAHMLAWGGTDLLSTAVAASTARAPASPEPDVESDEGGGDEGVGDGDGAAAGGNDSELA